MKRPTIGEMSVASTRDIVATYPTQITQELLNHCRTRIASSVKPTTQVAQADVTLRHGKELIVCKIPYYRCERNCSCGAVDSVWVAMKHNDRYRPTCDHKVQP